MNRRKESINIYLPSIAFVFPCIIFWELLGPRVVKHAVNNLMLKFLELRKIVLKMKGLRIHLECGSRFKNNKVVDLFIELIESYFQKIELSGNKKHVVDLPTFVSGGVGLPPTSMTDFLGIA